MKNLKELKTIPIVKLRVYKGVGESKEINHNADGIITNPNQLISLPHGTIEWKNYMKNILVFGYIRAEVEKVIRLNKEGEYVTLNKRDISLIAEEVDTAMSLDKSKTLTPEQKEIAALKKRLDAFMEGKEEKAQAPSPVKEEIEKPKTPSKEEGKNIIIE